MGEVISFYKVPLFVSGVVFAKSRPVEAEVIVRIVAVNNLTRGEIVGVKIGACDNGRIVLCVVS